MCLDIALFFAIGITVVLAVQWATGDKALGGAMGMVVAFISPFILASYIHMEEAMEQRSTPPVEISGAMDKAEFISNLQILADNVTSATEREMLLDRIAELKGEN